MLSVLAQQGCKAGFVQGAGGQDEQRLEQAHVARPAGAAVLGRLIVVHRQKHARLKPDPGLVHLANSRRTWWHFFITSRAAVTWTLKSALKGRSLTRCTASVTKTVSPFLAPAAHPHSHSHSHLHPHPEPQPHHAHRQQTYPRFTRSGLGAAETCHHGGTGLGRAPVKPLRHHRFRRPCAGRLPAAWHVGARR